MYYCSYCLNHEDESKRKRVHVAKDASNMLRCPECLQVMAEPELDEMSARILELAEKYDKYDEPMLKLPAAYMLEQATRGKKTSRSYAGDDNRVLDEMRCKLQTYCLGIDKENTEVLD